MFSQVVHLMDISHFICLLVSYVYYIFCMLIVNLVETFIYMVLFRIFCVHTHKHIQIAFIILEYTQEWKIWVIGYFVSTLEKALTFPHSINTNLDTYQRYLFSIPHMPHWPSFSYHNLIMSVKLFLIVILTLCLN